MINKTMPTYTIDIFMAGDIAQAKQICRQYCQIGFCVHIQPATYIYTGGEEEGFKVGIVQYPRFPVGNTELWLHANMLSKKLIKGLCQNSALIVAPDRTLWITNRRRDNVG